ncbi:MAG: TonB-dependent receptor, partial [Cyclobacteriaceae bacterium]
MGRRVKISAHFLFRLLIPFLAVFFNTAVSAQTVVTVIDSESLRPLEGVIIMSEPPEISAITNSHGRAELGNTSDSTELIFRLLGYELFQLSMEDIRDAGNTVSLQPSRLSLEQVVISATRWNQVTTRLPQKVASIKQADIQLHNPQTAADLLGVNSQVFIQKSQQGGGSPMIRGYSANRLLYAIDGVRMNTAIFRSGNLQNVISLDAMSIASTEVLFGPGSVMYGSDAIGAVMDFRTIEPQMAAGENQLISGSAAARFASANKEKTVHAHLNGGFSKWAFISSFTFTDFDDLRMGKNGPDDYLRTFYVERQGDSDVVIDNPNPRLQIPSGYSQRNFMQKIRFKPGNSWDLQYAFHYSRISEYDRYDRLIELRNGIPRSAEWKYGPQKWDMHLFTAKHKRREGFYDELAIRIYNQKFGESRIDRSFNDPVRRERIEQVDAYGMNLDFTERFGSRTTLNYGAEYVFNKVNSSGSGENIESGARIGVPNRYPDSRWQSAAVYALLQHEWTQDLFLQAGARYTYYSLYSDFSENQPYLNLP